jgi:hypothetical protein
MARSMAFMPPRRQARILPGLSVLFGSSMAFSGVAHRRMLSTVCLAAPANKPRSLATVTSWKPIAIIRAA